MATTVVTTKPTATGMRLRRASSNGSNPADRCRWNERPRNERAAADPNGGDLAERRQRCRSAADRYRKQMSDRTGERDAGKPGAVKTSNRPDDRERNRPTSLFSGTA